jgi:hypothetical protein
MVWQLRNCLLWFTGKNTVKPISIACLLDSFDKRGYVATVHTGSIPRKKDLQSTFVKCDEKSLPHSRPM